MDSFLPFACLLLGIALPVSVVGLAVRRGMNQLGAANAYRVVAERLGLQVDTRGVSLQGFLDDRRIWIGGVMVGHGPDRRTVTWGVVDLARPLGLGLLVRRRGLSDRLFRRSRAPEVRLDDADLRRRLEVRGDDPEHVRALLGRNIVAKLVALAADWPDVVITDTSVRVHLKQPEARPDALHALLDAMLDLARAIDQARTRVPAPPRLAATVDAWRALADSLGLTLEAWLPAMVGERDGRRVIITAWRGRGGFSASVRLRLADARPIGLGIVPHTEPDIPWSDGQDIQLGHPEFDRAFVVKGWDPLSLRELLGEDARAAITALAEVGAMSIDDRSVRVRHVPLDAAPVAEALRRAEAVAAALGR